MKGTVAILGAIINMADMFNPLFYHGKIKKKKKNFFFAKKNTKILINDK